MQEILSFLTQLQQNNTREWMQAHQKEYQNAKANFLELLAQLGEAMALFDSRLGHIEPKKCMFRLARDVRFGKDKTPYKIHFGAILSEEGKKTEKPFYYLHIEPNGKSFLAAGLYSPQSSILKKIREEIDYNGEGLLSVLAKTTIKKHFGTLSEIPNQKLKTAPRSYPKDHKYIDLLRNKSFVLNHDVTDKQALAKDFISYAATIYQAAKPFNDWLGVVFEEN
jgi:uncharacterized protein (TIGR02453 family)